MKAFKIVMKVAVALAAVAGAVYLAATYGERIAAWAKKTLGSCPLCHHEACDEDFEDDFVPAYAGEEAAGEAAEQPAEEAAEEPAEEAASEEDFEG